MPLRSLALIRRWLTPWAIAPLVILVPVFVNTTPPTDLWAPIVLSVLGAFLYGGIVAWVLWVAAISALKVPPASARSVVFAALAGAVVPIAPYGAWFGSREASIIIFACLSAIAAWQVAPSAVAMHVAPDAAPTT
jgi:hypothetical protein